jgi:class 3 adenylate cyclase
MKESEMIFSLQRRFLLFLLVPVTLILLVAGVASFFYARSYLLDEWKTVAQLRLEKTAHQIQMKVERVREVMDLIADAERMPNGAAAQVFLAERLSRQQGVRFVDLQTVRSDREQADQILQESLLDGTPKVDGHVRVTDHTLLGLSRLGSNLQVSPVDNLHQTQGGGTGGRVRSTISIDDSGRYLTLTREIEAANGNLPKRLVVRLSFDSFMEHVLEAGRWEGSYACLVHSDGSYIAHTSPLMKGLRRLGDAGDPLELKTLREMKKEPFGTVFGQGHPPDWVIGFYKVPTTDWYLILVSRGNVVMAPLVRFRFNYALAGIASLICIGLMIRWNTRPVAESVTEISAAAEQVENGNYSIEVREDRSDEIGQLKRRFNRMIGGLRQRDFIERTLGRYVDKKIAQELLSKPEALHLGGEKHVVTIMMSDLRGFTQMAEKIESEQVIKILNRYLARMIAVIEKHRGIIVDFYGDSVLAFFDGLEEDVIGRAADAVKAAVEMQRELQMVSKQNQEEGLPPIKMGIGIHTGEVVVGNIGSETRAKYGIVGSAVNETDRIQATAQGNSIMISEETYEALSGRVVVGRKTQTSLRGLEGYRSLYEVTSIDGQSHILGS